MSDNFEQAVDEVYEETIVEEEPKQGFIKRVGCKIKEAAAKAEEKHPKLVKVGKTVGKVAGAATLVVGGVVIGNAISKHDDYVDGDFPGYDEALAELSSNDEEVTE